MRALVVAVLALTMVGCGGDDGDGGDTGGAPSPLDPKSTHYGKTYAEWSVEWAKWFWELPQQGDQCVHPILDSTGEHCGAGQDPNDPVFFLVGNFGGVTVRDQCVAPKDEALFFPVLSYTADNAGVAPADQIDAAGLKAAAAGAMDVAKDLYASVDGREITDLGPYLQGPTELSYVVPPEPNTQSCFAMPGVVGEIKPAFVSGYFLMLPPLEAGKHQIQVKGRADIDPEDFVLDVTYELKVE